MCEFCNCRRFPEIARLGAEHDKIGLIADDILDPPASGEATTGELLRELRDHIEPHVSREEDGVFVQARSVGIAQNYWVEDLESDHRRFAEILERSESLTPDEIEAFLDDLHRHIAIEEYDLFPALARTLDDEDWAAIEQRLGNAGT
ncbi:MAG: hemerythrin domain-containing protein [Acidimicrobiia bacterium]